MWGGAHLGSRLGPEGSQTSGLGPKAKSNYCSIGGPGDDRFPTCRHSDTCVISGFGRFSAGGLPTTGLGSRTTKDPLSIPRSATRSCAARRAGMSSEEQEFISNLQNPRSPQCWDTMEKTSITEGSGRMDLFCYSLSFAAPHGQLQMAGLVNEAFTSSSTACASSRAVARAFRRALGSPQESRPRPLAQQLTHPEAGAIEHARLTCRAAPAPEARRASSSASSVGSGAGVGLVASP